MVFLVLATSDFSNKLSMLVLLVLQEPNGMVKNVDLKALRPVLLDMFSTLTSNSANHQLPLVVITLTSMEPPASVSQDTISSTMSASSVLQAPNSMELNVHLFRSLLLLPLADPTR